MKPPHRTALLLSCFLCLTGAVNAAEPVTLSPVAVLGTDLGTYSADVPVANMINQSGIAAPFISGSTLFDAYFATPGQPFGNATYTNNWQSDYTFNLPLMGYVDFDLGAAYSINKIAIWNISVRDVEVRVADTPEGLATGEVAGSFTLDSHLNFPFSYPVDVLSFGSTYQARYVRLAITSAHTFSPSDTFAYAIIGEVVVSAVPADGPVAPTVSIALTGEGNAEVTFTGTLQSSTNVLDGFEDVPGATSSPYVIEKGSLLPDQYFRAR